MNIDHAADELRHRLHELARRSRELMDRTHHIHEPEKVKEIEEELEAIRHAAIRCSRQLKTISADGPPNSGQATMK